MKKIALLLHEEADYPKGYNTNLINELEDLKENTYEDIYIGDLLDYFDTEKSIELLLDISSKLKEKGLLHIKAPDLMQMCWYVYKTNLDLPKFRYVLYDTKRTISYSMNELILILTDVKGITVQSASFCNGYEYSVTVRKL